MTDSKRAASDYNGEKDPRRKGDIFEKLVVTSLAKRYKGTIVTERNLGSATVFDGLTTHNGRPVVIEVKHRISIVSLSDGNTGTQLPRQVEMALSNEGVYELIIAPHTTIGPILRSQLTDLERSASLRWRISEFDPATGSFRLRCSSKADS